MSIALKTTSEQTDFQELADLVFHLTGIYLSPSEKNLELLKTRVMKLSKEYGQISLNEAANRIRRNDTDFIRAFICVITTNTTHFFREADHFEALAKILPNYLKEKSSNELRVWCAACSTGQEPYSLSIAIDEIFGNQVDLKLLATDIDPKVVRYAKDGVYEAKELENLRKDYKAKYFSTEFDSKRFRVSSFVKEKMKFALLNLLEMPYPFQHQFDVIFCRNVFIYFKQETIQTVVNEMSRFLRPGGYLFLGHSEPLTNIPKHLKRSGIAFYQKI